MHDRLIIGALLAVLSGVMNGTFTLPMRFLGDGLGRTSGVFLLLARASFFRR